MDAFSLGVLTATAIATAILSAIVGMAGGIVLLTVMLLFFEPIVAIPLHGLVQLVSNGSRNRHPTRPRRLGDRVALLDPSPADGLRRNPHPPGPARRCVPGR